MDTFSLFSFVNRNLTYLPADGLLAVGDAHGSSSVGGVRQATFPRPVQACSFGGEKDFRLGLMRFFVAHTCTGATWGPGSSGLPHGRFVDNRYKTCPLAASEFACSPLSVSYTHLTLPTKA